MRFDMFLNVTSSADAIRFYVEELGLFRVAIDYGMKSFLLCATESPYVCLNVGERPISISEYPRFGIQVDDCGKEFRRLRDIQFSKSAGIVPSREAYLRLATFPLGKISQ
ncbi:hypothetical protein Q4S45_22705 [Massilia sp. R2A-15]|uniref:hypothetical protein n=1 Tax=Massilia sp. R2A-15 TaxID=3064278 RepID=UPI00273330CA|nr:hypothetical protein [Massilia sp. R2A-15]WLI89469.1 hypothetical protein Q4S45_22705 [Massilia sp. R2A-15]